MADGAPPIFSGSPLEVRTGESCEIDDQAAGVTFNLVADMEVASLGIAFYNLPPGGATVKRIQPGSWAEKQLIKPEDEVISLNGMRVANMDEQDFVGFMKTRPLELLVVRPVAELDPCGVATPPVESRGPPSAVTTPIGTDAEKNNLPATGTDADKTMPTTGFGLFTNGFGAAFKEVICCGANRGSASHSQRRTLLLA